MGYIHDTTDPKYRGLHLETRHESFAIYTAHGDERIEFNSDQFSGLLEITKLVQLRIDGEAPGNGPAVKIPDFPDIGCAHSHLLIDGMGACGFTNSGIGLRCTEGRACGRYLHPGDPGHAELDDFHRAMSDHTKVTFTTEPPDSMLRPEIRVDDIIEVVKERGGGYRSPPVGTRAIVLTVDSKPDTYGQTIRILWEGEGGWWVRADEVKRVDDHLPLGRPRKTNAWADAAAQFDQQREQAKISGDAVVTVVQIETGVLVLLISDGDVWLAERTDPSRPYFGAYASPGGCIELGETPHQAARRELREETGLDLQHPRLMYGGLTEHTHEDGRPFKMHWYYVKLKPGEIPQRTEPNKQGEWRRAHHGFMHFDAPNPPNVTPGTKAAITGARERGLFDTASEATVLEPFAQLADVDVHQLAGETDSQHAWRLVSKARAAEMEARAAEIPQPIREARDTLSDHGWIEETPRIWKSPGGWRINLDHPSATGTLQALTVLAKEAQP